MSKVRCIKNHEGAEKCTKATSKGKQSVHYLLYACYSSPILPNTTNTNSTCGDGQTDCGTEVGIAIGLTIGSNPKNHKAKDEGVDDFGKEGLKGGGAATHAADSERSADDASQERTDEPTGNCAKGWRSESVLVKSLAIIRSKNDRWEGAHDRCT